MLFPLEEAQMEQESPPSKPEGPLAGAAPCGIDAREEPLLLHVFDVPERLRWMLFGERGLRAGWSVAIFAALYYSFREIGRIFLGTIYATIFPDLWKEGFSVRTAILGESVPLFGLIGAALVVAWIEGRKGNLLAFNLKGSRHIFNFIFGLLVGFAALSVLIAGLAWGGWLQFGPISLYGAGILKYGVLWAVAFLLVGLMEEGSFRCYLQFTLTRGINFWWALGAIALICGYLMWEGDGNGVWGVYAMAALGLIPCLLLELFKTPGANFWQAAWVTSTLFGAIHTDNNGENWIGIFAAAMIGFAFCVSIWATGSAWWAIGCHAAWDWAETYFYGTADSGLAAKGHYLTTNPVGAAIWSGGADGPEGSLLVIAVVLLLLLFLVVYGRWKRATVAAPISYPLSQQAAG
jgi:hypothetical protein